MALSSTIPEHSCCIEWPCSPLACQVNCAAVPPPLSSENNNRNETGPAPSSNYYRDFDVWDMKIDQDMILQQHCPADTFSVHNTLLRRFFISIYYLFIYLLTISNTPCPFVQYICYYDLGELIHYNSKQILFTHFILYILFQMTT